MMAKLERAKNGFFVLTDFLVFKLFQWNQVIARRARVCNKYSSVIGYVTITFPVFFFISKYTSLMWRKNVWYYTNYVIFLVASSIEFCKSMVCIIFVPIFNSSLFRGEQNLCSVQGAVVESARICTQPSS